MRKCCFILSVLIAHIAPAQIVHGTVLVFNFSENQLVVAADSRLIYDNPTFKPDDSKCKIAAFNRKIVFTSTGGYGYIKKSVLDPVEGWDNFELATTTVNAAPKIEIGDALMDWIANDWESTVGTHWLSRYTLDPLAVTQMANKSNGSLTIGVFIGAANGNIYGRIAVIYLDTHGSSRLPTIKRSVAPIGAMTDCWACGQGQSGKVCVGGTHIDFAAKICSKREDGSKADARTHLDSANQYTDLAVEIAEKTTEAYGEGKAGDVGGAIDAITIKGDGTITWNARKPRCPETQ